MFSMLQELTDTEEKQKRIMPWVSKFNKILNFITNVGYQEAKFFPTSMTIRFKLFEFMKLKPIIQLTESNDFMANQVKDIYANYNGTIAFPMGLAHLAPIKSRLHKLNPKAIILPDYKKVK